MKNNSGTAWEEVGCIALIALFALPYILQSLFVALMPYILLGAVGLGIYRVYVYDTKTGAITEWLEEHFGLPNSKKKQKKKKKKAKRLAAPKKKLLSKMEELDKKMVRVELENEQLKANREQDIKDALDLYSSKIEKEKKLETLKEIFGDESSEYNQSATFEKQQHQEQVKKQKEELEIENLKLNTEKQLFEQDKKIYDVRTEAKEDRFSIRMEMNEGFWNLNAKILHLSEKIDSVQVFVVEKFSHMETQFYNELNNVNEKVSKLRVELKQDISDTRVMFGKEIMRLDKQQLKIVGKLQEYSNQVKSYFLQVSKVKMDAEKNNMRAEEMLNRANNAYQHHKAEIRMLSKDLTVGLQQISLHKGDFANKVGEAKLMLDRISQDQYFALKDIAIEKVGVNMLRQDYQQRVNVSEQKMNSLIQEKRHLEEKINIALSHGKETAGLQHRLSMTREDLRHASHQNSLLNKENSLIRQLSR